MFHAGKARQIGFIVMMLLCSSVGVMSVNHKQAIVTQEPVTKNSVTLTGIPHSPIIIDGDINFSDTVMLEGWPGDGSLENPYVIDNLDIDLGGVAGHCISISNTQVNFTISNCFLTGASVDPGSGIYLEDGQNAKVVDNICQRNPHGVLVQGRGSKNCILSDNTCTQNSVSGIQLAATSNNTLKRNNCTDNYHGINVIDISGLSGVSEYHVISNNYCSNNSFGISLGDFNIENVAPLRSIISDNNCSGNREDGIRLISSYSNTISNNSCIGNDEHGIMLRAVVVQNCLVNNTCNENGQSGIFLDHVASFNNFTNNLCWENSQYGIYIEFSSTDNNFSWNVFGDNLVGNAFDDAPDNIFDYNYWSDYAGNDDNADYIGDTPYAFTTNSDLHPLMFIPIAPEWVETPVDQTIEYDTHFSYDLNATASGPITWSINWTFHLSINSQGVIESIGHLSLGNYGIEVNATTVYGFSISAKLTVRVVLAIDITSPSWVVTPADVSIGYGVGVDIQIHALDLSGIDHWTLNDTTHFSLNAIYYELGSTAKITNKSALDPKSYGLTITVFDRNNNHLTAMITITIIGVTPSSPPTSATPISVDFVLTFVMGAGFGGMAVLVLFSIVLRRK